MKIITADTKTALLHQYLVSAIAPRPICFASTVDADGIPNLSPYSYFNLMGTNPAILVFSASRRVRNNTIKHTLENVQVTGEVVINMVSHSMVHQMSLSSCEYPKGVDEFEKAGFTKLASEQIKPWRVAESPVQMECKVLDIIATGAEGGAGNLVICQVLVMHINDEILDANQKIDPHKIDLVARMGADNYCRASGNAVFAVAKPNTQLGIGVDSLPQGIKWSKILTGNHLGQLANVEQMPEADPAFSNERVRNIIQYFSLTPPEMEEELHKYAAQLLDAGEVADAWQVLLADL